jgi:hypothetical protein
MLFDVSTHPSGGSVNRSSTAIDNREDSGERAGMPTSRDGTEHLRQVLADLEQQADGLHLADRDALVAEQSRAEYARVSLEDRLHGSVGCRLQVAVRGLGRLDGELGRVGAGWCLLENTAGSWVVRNGALTSLQGLADRATPTAARPVTARLGLGSALRGLAGSRAQALVHRVDGTGTPGLLGRVGEDFVEVRSVDPGGYVVLVPFAALAAVCGS